VNDGRERAAVVHPRSRWPARNVVGRPTWVLP